MTVILTISVSIKHPYQPSTLYNIQQERRPSRPVTHQGAVYKQPRMANPRLVTVLRIPAYFEAAVGVFCGDECHGQDGCRSATGRTLNSADPLWATGLGCSIAQAANSSLCCEPYNYEGYGGPYGPPFWPASGLNFNVALKITGGTNCNWKLDRDTCVNYLRNAFNGCPFGGVDWNECVA